MDSFTNSSSSEKWIIIMYWPLIILSNLEKLILAFRILLFFKRKAVFVTAFICLPLEKFLRLSFTLALFSQSTKSVSFKFGDSSILNVCLNASFIAIMASWFKRTTGLGKRLKRPRKESFQ